MKLGVHIWDDSEFSDWAPLLMQIGCDYSIQNSPPNDQFPICIYAKNDQTDREYLNTYLSKNRCIILEASAAHSLFDIQISNRKVEFVLIKRNEIFTSNVLFQLPLNTKCAANSNFLTDLNGNFLISVQKIQNGLLIILPDGFAKFLYEETAKRRHFSRIENSRFPTERVANIDKHAVFTIFRDLLKYAFHQQSLPFIFKWYFPNTKSNIFSFRIDTDFANLAEIEQLHNLCEKHRISASWFVETKSAEKFINVFSKMPNQEIGLHCYNHYLPNNISDIFQDIESGNRVLEGIKIKPSGYAAPFGDWNPNLASVLNEMNFLYSSEFAFAFDSLPLSAEKIVSKALQIPIHPVSVNRLNLARMNTNQMISYYKKMIQKAIDLHFPAIIYHHPGQHHLHVFETIFKYVHELDLEILSMGNFATWWKKRIEKPISASFYNGNIILNNDSENTNIAVWENDNTISIYKNADFSSKSTTAEQTINSINTNTYIDLEITKRNYRLITHSLMWHYSKWKQRKNR